MQIFQNQKLILKQLKMIFSETCLWKKNTDDRPYNDDLSGNRMCESSVVPSNWSSLTFFFVSLFV